MFITSLLLHESHTIVRVTSRISSKPVRLNTSWWLSRLAKFLLIESTFAIAAGNFRCSASISSGCQRPVSIWSASSCQARSYCKMSDKKAFQRLPQDVVPHNYALRLTPDLNAFTFEGQELISVKVNCAICGMSLQPVMSRHR